MATKIHDLKSLHERIQTLRLECKNHEQRIADKFTYYQENAGSIILESVLRSIMGISFVRMLQSWIKYDPDASKQQPNDKNHDLLQAALTLGLTLGLKYFNRLFK
jgi:hypothetical protein